MTNQPDEFDDFFQDDDFDLDNLDQPQFGQDDFDEDLLADSEQEGGVSRTFVVIAVLLAVVFVVLVAVGAAILLGRGGDECDERCLQATQISGTNFAIETQQRASETALSIQSTNAQETAVAENATATEVVNQQSTATRASENTQVAATETAQSINATATQAEIFRQQTLAVQSSTPPTATPSNLEGDVKVNDGPAAGVTVCVFRDNGDGRFNPNENTSVDCSPTALGAGAATAIPASATPSPDGGGATEAVSSPTPEGAASEEAPAATAEATEETAPSGAPTTRPLNPIFQTATAAAGGGGSTGGGTTDGGTTGGDTSAPASPTPESLESGFDSDIYGPVGRSGLRQDGEGDDFVTSEVTDTNGHFIIDNLPAGTYWIKVADQTLQIEVTTEPQVLVIPRESGAPIVIEIRGTGGGELPTASPIGPIFQTASAIVQQTLQITPASPTPVSGLPSTGVFSGDGGNVTGVDLLILGLIGLLLVAVVLAARKMRSTTP